MCVHSLLFPPMLISIRSVSIKRPESARSLLSASSFLLRVFWHQFYWPKTVFSVSIDRTKCGKRREHREEITMAKGGGVMRSIESERESGKVARARVRPLTTNSRRWSFLAASFLLTEVRRDLSFSLLSYELRGGLFFFSLSLSPPSLIRLASHFSNRFIRCFSALLSLPLVVFLSSGFCFFSIFISWIARLIRRLHKNIVKIIIYMCSGEMKCAKTEKWLCVVCCLLIGWSYSKQFVWSRPMRARAQAGARARATEERNDFSFLLSSLYVSFAVPPPIRSLCVRAYC